MPNLKQLVNKYSLKDVLHADECGLFFGMAPDRTMAREALPGSKMKKTELQFPHVQTQTAAKR